MCRFPGKPSSRKGGGGGGGCRTRGNLHTLGAGIRKLICPEFQRLHIALQRSVEKCKPKDQSAAFDHPEGFCDRCLEKENTEDFIRLFTLYSSNSGIKAEQLRQSLGEELFKICFEEDEQILKLVSRTLRDFLNSFNTLLKHDQSHLEGDGDVKALQESSILCLEENDGPLKVYCFFPNELIGFILPGLIKAAAQMLYEDEVRVELVPRCSEDGVSDFPNCTYLMYIVSQTKVKTNSLPQLRNTSTVANVPVSTFCKTFPFHFLFDRAMWLMQIGDGMRRLLNKRDFLKRPNFNEHFQIITPPICGSFSGIRSMLNTQFIIRIRQDHTAKEQEKVMDIKGQMIYVPESKSILFLGSPYVDKLEEFTGRGLYLSDIPIHNALRDVILVGEQTKAQDGLKKRLGKLKGALEKVHQALEEEKKKTVDLLFTIFPGKVAQQLWQGQSVQAKKFENVTMLFSDIVGFTAVCGRCSPMQVVTMLNELYTMFDYHCGELDIYKVETIGDAYCVAGGLHKESKTHAVQIALMALKMMEMSDKVTTPDGEPIKLRIGLHSGSILAGVVGVKMPRYCLFGNNVTLANKFESTSFPRRINVSPTTYALLKDDSGFKFTPRSIEDLPPNFPDEIPGICYFLDAHHPIDGTNFSTGLEDGHSKHSNTVFMRKATK
ncbi:guanylate cyclase soluble subunit alpha-1-like [Callorhinchus milii]|uniref:guanylate cyclase soluble subunit alpha-1-like n=1 Tax=Callorhinchus milii TaxID=7868 RepID=UPI001C3F5437|nr:guanylate cyclase soluble subunit alpha-1-like [Callorhinchus milii]